MRILAAWMMAGVGVGGAAVLAQEGTMRSDRTAGPYRVVGEVVSIDAGARTITVRDVSRRADATGSSDMPRSGRAEDTFTLALSGGATGQAERHRAGDWVELTCGDDTSAITAAPAPQATPGPAPMGTGALPGTGTTGVGTTGTGISGGGAPAPASTPDNAARDASRAGAPTGSAADRFAGWVRTNCAVVTAIDRSQRPGPARR